MYLLGIDNGLTMAKAAVFTLDGREVAVASRKTETLTPKPGHLERDVREMWASTAAVIREAIAKAGIQPSEVACVACAGHGNGLYLINEAGEPVRNAILSTDSRARDIVAEWLAAGVDEVVRPKTTQSVWAAQPGVLLQWLKRHEPAALERARWALMAKDYIRYKLTGEVAAEVTDFSGASLLDVPKMAYDDSLLAAFGITDLRRLLPPLLRSADIAGAVTAQAAAETGLAAGTLVAGGVFDIDACGLAVGLVDESPLCAIAGTWGNNQYISRKPVVSPEVFMTSCYAIPGYFLILEGSATSASNLEWFVTEFFGAEKALAAKQGRSVYDLCNELVAASRPEEANIAFLPFLYGSNAGPDATACFVGLSGWHTRGHVLRAIYEGVVFGHRTHIERLLKFRARPAAVRLTGGAARSEAWVQIFADALQTPVEIPEGTELGALGAAIAAAVAAGIYATFEEAVDAMVRFARRREPDRSRQSLYDAKFERYHRTIRALDPVWASYR
ncbi:MAG TPA: FGGY-family carbohydrate kinase [Planctomycetota bacterium]|nr:FGGY-family carbohydrate kinase [Planctomycetota bacterium]HRR83072.1 FGGY-family carbohydrate kinase [Planctomycetota bacterium]HRT93289.1 FGGY-family carbohydrate kinase [Planctomycetota bacterium]